MSDPSESNAPRPPASEEPASAPTPDGAAGKTATPPPVAEPLSLVPRSRAGTKEGGEPAAPTGAPASVSEFMHWMKMFSAAAEATPTTDASPSARQQRSTLPKEQRKFQRYEREPAAPETAAAPGASTEADSPPVVEQTEGLTPSAVEGEKPSAPGRPLPMTPGRSTSGRRSRPPGSRWPVWWWLVVLVLLVGSFLWGRSTGQKSVLAADAGRSGAQAPEGSVGNPLNPEAAKLIDQAMAAEQDTKFQQASDLLLKVQKDYPHIRGLDYRLANLAFENGNPTQALRLLNQSIAEGEQVSAAYKLHGTILRRRGGARVGMNDFESATIADPFAADNFYYWGEALRRAGKPQAALVRLQEAIDRLREPTLESEYRLAIRLALIELGREKEFGAEMSQELAENPPPPDWLLTAAAFALQHDDSATAASYLEKASRLMDRPLFEFRLGDYLFYSHRDDKTLAKFFKFGAPPPATVPAAEKASAQSPPPADQAASPSKTP